MEGESSPSPLLRLFSDLGLSERILLHSGLRQWDIVDAARASPVFRIEASLKRLMR